MSTIPPDRGPAILFFTGGTAIRELSRQLKTLTHRSIHLTSPFDSGGSSAPLRDTFDMLAVGDIRNRITALLDDDTATGHAFARLLEDRFAEVAVPAALRNRLAILASGKAALVANLPRALQDIVRADLGAFAEACPEEFDLKGASVGNLALVGGFLRNNRDINRTLGNLTSAARIRGIIRPVAATNAHLAALLENGKTVVGQHRITSKVGYVDSPIKELVAINNLAERMVVQVGALPLAVKLVGQADAICYPMGSFWTSIAANLLPRGIGGAIADSKVRKIYIPSTGRDPEALGMSLSSALEVIAAMGRHDAGPSRPLTDFVDTVILDRERLRYQLRLDVPAVKRMGVSVIERSLSGKDMSHDPQRLATLLMQICGA